MTFWLRLAAHLARAHVPGPRAGLSDDRGDHLIQRMTQPAFREMNRPGAKDFPGQKRGGQALATSSL